MSEPPPASSWAAPPEFYVDENIAGKSVRRCLTDLGYTVHTPPSLYGTREASAGVPDEIWLKDVGERRWVALARDTAILQRPSELEAYLAAKIHLFLLAGNATRQQLIDTLHGSLRHICTMGVSGSPGVWRVHGGDIPFLESLDVERNGKVRRRRV